MDRQGDPLCERASSSSAWLAAVAVLALGMAHLPMIALPAAIAAMIALRLALETVARTGGLNPAGVG